MTGNPFGFTLPQVCCSCLGNADSTHEVSSFYGEGGKSIEAKFRVPLCRKCRSRMLTRERITYASLFVLLAISALFLSPYAPVSEAMRGSLRSPAAVVIALAFIGVFLVGIGRPFEPGRYFKGKLSFRNPEYQRLFEEANNQSREKDN